MKEQNKEEQKHMTLKNIHSLFFRNQIILISILALFLGIAGTLINIHFETEKRDQNLQNIAEAIARSPILINTSTNNVEESAVLSSYLDSLKETLGNIDVISVVNQNNIRIYHSNHSLIGTIYDGNQPEFHSVEKGFYTVDETGPSGTQRRAYAAIYDETGNNIGFVMAIMLMKHIKSEILQTFFVFSLITIVAILIEILITAELSGEIKKSLMGYEPDVFTAMYKMRDTILETLEEGILAIDNKGVIQFANEAALRMLNTSQSIIGKQVDTIGNQTFFHTLMHGEKELNINLSNTDIIFDRVPIKDDMEMSTIAILHNRAEYTKLMEDLSGTRYLVDSMRANNHDFTNKLHVILGLLQMEMYEEATAYIQNITMVQRTTISKIMNAVSEPAVAALLIGKTARASELNIKFILREGCYYSTSDMQLPAEMLVTIIGNLLDNAFDAMNESEEYDLQKELLFGIFSKPNAVLITVDDTGTGIAEQNIPYIFEKGYSTKGKERGMGLYQVKTMVEGLDGKITVESQKGIGTSFSISFTREQ